MTGEYYKETEVLSKSYIDRYRNCLILTDIDSGETFLSTREIVDIPVNANDKYHTVESHETTRLDLIAAKYYRNPLMWWIIAQANNIYDPFEEIEAGTLLRIPALESLYGNNGLLL